ncbi:VF530 family protein [Tenacibaculum piscium]|uniref:VF530 family protein n=1 Tax=Tenacibaculum piscium TaxID=1458515 RepID=UPI0021D408AB|nr:VF530 family protein [Tenacibaculum piscium]
MDIKSNQDKNQQYEKTTEKAIKKIRKQATQEQLDNPLHGVKLVQVLERLVAYYGWEYLGERVNIRCFINNPSMKSSLGFLRKTAWAREYVEDIYLEMIEKTASKE